jgi:hypothetical protein
MTPEAGSPKSCRAAQKRNRRKSLAGSNPVPSQMALLLSLRRIDLYKRGSFVLEVKQNGGGKDIFSVTEYLGGM